MESALRSPSGLSAEVWLWGAASFLNAFIVPPLFTLVFVLKCYFNLTAEEFVSKTESCVNLIYIEFLRSWGKIFQWSFAFLIPGILRWFQYLFVPLVVLFDSAYFRGEKDALETSRSLYRRRWKTLTVLIIGAWIIYPMVSSTVFDQYRIFWTHSWSSLLIGALDFAVTTITTYFVVKIFLQINREVGNELNVPMERH